MLFYSVPQSLGRAFYIPRITLTRKLVDNATLFDERNSILLNGWKGSPSTVNNTGIDSKETVCDALFYLTFKSLESVTRPR